MSVPGEYIPPVKPTSLAQVLASSVASPRFCVELTCGLFVPNWTLQSSNTYYTYIGTNVNGTSYYDDNTDEIVTATVNGVGLTAAADVAGCTATPGTFFWDAFNCACWIHLSDNSSPQARGTTVMLTCMLRLSDGATDAGGYRWRPWITQIPNLSRRIASDFNSIPQISGGPIVMQNEAKIRGAHYFDSRYKRNWDAGSVVIKMGAAGLPFNQFKKLATFLPSSPKLTDKNFVVNVQDRRVLLDTFYPTRLYNSTDYPNIDPQVVGSPIQMAFGTLLGVVPVCINTSTLEFMVAGHPIHSFDGVRVLNNTTGIWETKSFNSVDEQNGRFTMNSLDWQPGLSIVVDFSGWVNDDGSTMENPANIVSAILQDMGQPIAAAGFADAAAWYDVGYTGEGVVKKRVTSRAPSFYLNSQGKALKLIEQIMVNVRAYLIIDENGDFSMVPFRNYAVSELPTIDDTMMLGVGLVADGSGTSSFRVQAGQKLSAMTVVYGTRSKEGISSTVTYTSAFNNYSRNSQSDTAQVFQSMFTKEADAAYLAQSLVNEYRVDPLFYTLELKWAAWLWVPGVDHVHIVDQRHNIDVVAEIVNLDINLGLRKVTLTLGNLRGFDEASGFWVLNSDTTPSGADLSWPQQGEALAPYETQYRRHQAAHWHGADDFAVDTTNPANKYTALDYETARFQ